MTMSPTLGSRIRVNDDVLFQELHGEAVLLNLKTGVYFGLDSVGTRAWQLLPEHPVLSQILEVIVREYDVAEERCAEDLIRLIAEMREHELVTLVDATPPGQPERL